MEGVRSLPDFFYGDHACFHFVPAIPGIGRKKNVFNWLFSFCGFAVHTRAFADYSTGYNFLRAHHLSYLIRQKDNSESWQPVCRRFMGAHDLLFDYQQIYPGQHRRALWRESAFAFCVF